MTVNHLVPGSNPGAGAISNFFKSNIYTFKFLFCSNFNQLIIIRIYKIINLVINLYSLYSYRINKLHKNYLVMII